MAIEAKLDLAPIFANRFTPADWREAVGDIGPDEAEASAASPCGVGRVPLCDGRDSFKVFGHWGLP